MFGYSVDWQVIPAEAEFVRRAADRLLAGASLAETVRDLTNAGMRTTGGRDWTPSNFGRFLRSPSIAGLRKHHDRTYEGTWQPLLDRDKWTRVVAALDRRRGLPGGGRRQRLLTGVAYCTCGGRMNGVRNGKGLPRYQCQRALRVAGTERQACGKVGIAGDPLDELVTAEVLAALDGPGLRAMVGQRSRKDRANAATFARLDELELRLEQLAVDHYANGLLKRSEFMAARSAIEREATDLQSRLRTDARASVLGSVGPDIRDWWQTADIDARRAVIAAVLDRVVVGPVLRGGRGMDPNRVEFLWADRAAV